MCIYDVKYIIRAFWALFYLLRKVGRRNMGIEVKKEILCKPYGIIKSTPQILFKIWMLTLIKGMEAYYPRS